ncbi:MAG: hypothetical protein FWC38_08700 [Proteobacteria bacterium]|nr:hypothetical protein [Pseudomonadota bacterium]
MSAMNREEMQRQLQLIYEDWKRSLRFDKGMAEQLSPPLLLSVPEAYTNAECRILFFGQETFGWEWGSDHCTKYPDYPNYPYNDIRSMQDFLANSDAVEALCWCYDQFNFSDKQKDNFNSPLWRAFRKVQDWPGVGLIWSNLFRCDYKGDIKKGRSVLRAPEALRDSLLKAQREFVEQELKVLRPDICLFFTGPRYDLFLYSAFPGCALHEAVSSISDRQLARIQHSDLLPTNSFRTYHPGYLNRKRLLESFLKQLKELAWS